MAQDTNEVKTIRIKKKRVVYPSTPVADWGPRPFSCDPPVFYRPPQVYFFAGYEYFKYSYFSAGVRSAREGRFISVVGLSLETCFDKEVYGVGMFARKRIALASRSSLSLGANTGAYVSPIGSFYTASPTVTFQTTGWCLRHLEFSYGYKFQLAHNAHLHERMAETPALPVNTHHFTLTYTLPFYLYF